MDETINLVCLCLSQHLLQEAAEWLSSHPSVRPTGIGAVGVSRGGAQALLMAMICPQVSSASVTIHSPLNFG